MLLQSHCCYLHTVVASSLFLYLCRCTICTAGLSTLLLSPLYSCSIYAAVISIIQLFYLHCCYLHYTAVLSTLLSSPLYSCSIHTAVISIIQLFYLHCCYLHYTAVLSTLLLSPLYSCSIYTAVISIIHLSYLHSCSIYIYIFSNVLAIYTANMSTLLFYVQPSYLPFAVPSRLLFSPPVYSNCCFNHIAVPSIMDITSLYYSVQSDISQFSVATLLSPVCNYLHTAVILSAHCCYIFIAVISKLLFISIIVVHFTL